MISISTLFPASLLLAGGLVAAQAENIEAELFKPTRYIVEFSDAGSAKFRKRDGESVSNRYECLGCLSPLTILGYGGFY